MSSIFFFLKGNPIFSIKLRQRLLKWFSQLHVKNSRFFLSYFLKKDDWPKANADLRLPTFPYPDESREYFSSLNFDAPCLMEYTTVVKKIVQDGKYLLLRITNIWIIRRKIMEKLAQFRRMVIWKKNLMMTANNREKKVWVFR